MISIEGSIGCGKSTLIDIMKDVYKENKDVVILLTAKMLYHEKKMNHVEYSIYMNWFSIVSKNFKHVFIDCDYPECYKRIHIRNR
jgi:deoxyadenosine/deoxycytidine kinase